MKVGKMDGGELMSERNFCQEHEFENEKKKKSTIKFGMVTRDAEMQRVNKTQEKPRG